MASSEKRIEVKPGSVADPLWYKEAIIYELHVRAFKDSNGDGIGDFPGLMQKLDYLQDLGVTCLWLLPFFPSPLRDDGYDVSDYLGVHPMYGTLDDFRAVLDAAHDRNLQVIIELVVNHTSDQHPWFQAARQAPPGSPERDFYVWSDTDEKYKDARIIFTDTERSNWTWDAVAKAYYWHRFFSHQPDLNYDNPQVLQEVLNVMRYWLDMGVDGLRVDAVPYLVEREGTNCENLPETHEIVRKIRAAIDAEYSGRMLLAEANQWPSDVRPYFGKGDEFHMAFHFPVMPRIYMALRQEDRLPITDIIAQTPAIPETCQWGLFLRNHDELTLEMVTNEERDYMYLAYSGDPRMRINLGIRRRLAPLVDNNRRRIELLNSLLFSFPGTPILYYGDEIGMGDNIYLGDRNGVRTPMQWNADRNAGFSTANPARLYSPVIMDPVWGYEAVNVEAEQGDPSSLLNWMRNMIALRKLFRVFGRGSIEFLEPRNRKVLAYLRRLEGEQILCVANLSRFAQSVDLDLSSLEGMVPVEMIGYGEFPHIERAPYRLTVGPYGFLWFELQQKNLSSESTEMNQESAPLALPQGIKSIFDEDVRARLESVDIPDYLRRQRWFGGKSRGIVSSRMADWMQFEQSGSILTLVEVGFQTGPPETYLLLLRITVGDAAEELRKASPQATVASIAFDGSYGVLYDAVFDDLTCAELLADIAHGAKLAMSSGHINGNPSKIFEDLRGVDQGALAIRRGSAEQSNTSIIYGDRFILKLFRRNAPGENPDREIGKYLAEKTRFDRVAPFAGSLDYSPQHGDSTVLAVLQGLVTNEGDGWKWTLEELERYYEDCAIVPAPENLKPESIDFMDTAENPAMLLARERVGLYLNAANVLGRRTAELHIALASAKDDPSFAPEPFTADDLKILLKEIRQHASRTFDILKDKVAQLTDDVVELAAAVLSRRSRILEYFREVESGSVQAEKIRVHGDYHLGQVLRVKGDFVILDFEGEPNRPLAERRAKQCAIKDVAGMLRSFSYAAYSSLIGYATRHPEGIRRLEPWERLWEGSVSAEFLKGYRQAAQDAPFLPADAEDFRKLLDILLLDKALYEVRYEMDNRPGWLRIPLMGIMSLSL